MALPEDRPKDGSSGSEDHNGHEDRAADSEDIHTMAVVHVRCNCCPFVQTTEGMVDLIPIGPCRILEAYGCLGLKVIAADDEVSCIDWWDVTEDEDVEEYTQILSGGLGRKLEVTYLVMPDAIETHVKVRLNLKDLGSRSRDVYGSIKASAVDYGGKSVHLFSCERGRSWSLRCGSACSLPLAPYIIALPYHRHFKIHIEVDLRVITTWDSQEEDKSLKFCLDFTRGITSQEREVDGDQVEVNITWYLED
ncbi:hypothetical protein EJB05_10460, partial [Eragrostis curvula]